MQTTSGQAKASTTELERKTKNEMQKETQTEADPHDRYSRQQRFAGIGAEGQRQLSQARLLILGAGALGAACAETMVRAGVGSVTIVDRDVVEWSNLQRQNLYAERDAADRLPKAAAAAERLAAVNSSVHVRGIVADVTTREIRTLVRDVDLVLDAADNFEIRMILNDRCQEAGIPWIYGACVGSYGLSFTVLPGVTPCLNCLLDYIPAGGDTCETAGIIAPAVQMTAAYQTAEALKLLSGRRDALRGTLVSFDLWSNHSASVDVSRLKRDDCPSCGTHAERPYLSLLNHPRTAVLCGRNTVQIRPAEPQELELDEWARKLAVHGEVEANPHLLSFRADGCRLVLFADGRVLVHGTDDPARARSLAHRFFG